MSVKMKKKISNVKLKYLLTWQLQHFSSKNELNKTFLFVCPYVICVMKLVDMKCKMNKEVAADNRLSPAVLDQKWLLTTGCH